MDKTPLRPWFTSTKISEQMKCPVVGAGNLLGCSGNNWSQNTLEEYGIIFKGVEFATFFESVLDDNRINEYYEDFEFASEILGVFKTFQACFPNKPSNELTFTLSRTATTFWNRYLRVLNFPGQESAVDDLISFMFKEVFLFDIGGFDVISKPQLKLSQGNNTAYFATPDVAVSHTDLKLISCLVHENKSSDSTDAAFPQAVAESFAAFQYSKSLFLAQDLRLDTMNLFSFVCQGLKFSFMKLFITYERNLKLEKGQEVSMTVYRYNYKGEGFSMFNEDGLKSVFNGLALIHRFLANYCKNTIIEVK